MLQSLRLDGLWRHPDFLKLWAGHTVSVAGGLISRFALPLVAILTLDASPGEVALIRMADTLPGIIIGLAAGVWVDRLRRRPLMIWADVGRAVLLAWIPLAAIFGLLGIWQLFAVVMAAGTLTALFEVANRSYLPTLIPRERLVEANSKLSASGSVVEVAAFGFAGLLVQVLTAPVTVLLDAMSFVVSALFLRSIKAKEPPPAPTQHQSMLASIREGLRFVYRDPILRALAGARVTTDLFLYIWVTMLLVFLTRDLELEPVVFGVLFGIGGICSFFGALVAGRVERWLGLGPTLIVTLFISTVSLLSVPMATGPFVLAVLFVGIQQLSDAPAVIFEIHEASLIQSRVPDEVMGRVTACLRVLTWSAVLIGTVLGGVLGELVGPRMTMLIGAAGTMPAVFWLIFSPVRTLRRFPTPPSAVT